MRKFLLLAGAMFAMAAAQPAAAATIINKHTTIGTLSETPGISPGQSLLNNTDPYANKAWDAFILNEGTFNGQQSFLLHYDRGGGALSVGAVMGSFEIQLGEGETWGGYVWKSADLKATDPLANGALYQRDNSFATGVRGVEFGDAFTVNQTGANTWKVNYLFTTDGLGLDEMRFFVDSPLSSAVPEPATWAMMITGFGLAGSAIRRRRTVFAAA